VKDTRTDQEVKDDLYDWLKEEDRIKDALRRLKDLNPYKDEKMLLGWLKDDIFAEHRVVIGILDKVKEKGKITVFRAMIVPDLATFSNNLRMSGNACPEGKYDGIGESWAWSFDRAEVYQTYCQGKTYILKATARFEDINIDDTIWLYHTMNENEIRLYGRRKVLLESIHDKNGEVIETFDPPLTVRT